MILERRGKTGIALAAFLVTVLVMTFAVPVNANTDKEKAPVVYSLNEDQVMSEDAEKDKIKKYIWDDEVDEQTALSFALKENGFEGDNEKYEAIKDLLVKILYYGYPESDKFTEKETRQAVLWAMGNVNDIGDILTEKQKEDTNYNDLCEKAFKGDIPKYWQMFVYVEKGEDPEEAPKFFIEGEFKTTGLLSSRTGAVLSGKRSVSDTPKEQPLAQSGDGVYNSRSSSSAQNTTDTTTQTNNAINSNSQNNNSTNTNTVNNSQTNTTQTSRTGDDVMLTLIILIMITSLGLAIATLQRKRRFDR